MTSRQVWILTLAVPVVLGAVAIRVSQTADLLAGLRFGMAVSLAVGVIALAASVSPPDDRRGLVVGGCFVGAGLLSWTATDKPVLVWALLALEGGVFLLWSFPWLRHVGPATRLGTAWLGVSYWLLGVVGGLLMTRWEVAAERLAYAGVFGLAVLAVLCRSRVRDLSAGIGAAFLYALGAILLAGAGNLFEDTHVVPPHEWGAGLEYRFWGGEYLLYQPNSMAALAVVAAARVGVDRGYAAWQRLAVTGLAGFIVYVTHSRTGWVMVVTAALVHAVLLYWRTPRWGQRGVATLPYYGTGWRRAAAATVPLLLSVLVLVGWLTPQEPSRDNAAPPRPGVVQPRYASGGVTSGRLDTWRQVGAEWLGAGPTERLLGDTRTTRAVVHRKSSGENVQLTTDNAAVGALRRGGALGLLAFILGLGLLVWHVYRRRTPAWFVVAVAACLPPVMTSDALLGGTGGTVWVLLLAGEARLLFGLHDGTVEWPRTRMLPSPT